MNNTYSHVDNGRKASPFRRVTRKLALGTAAVALSAGVLPLAVSPASAANSSYEVLVDTNDDGTPDAREFAGRDRYDTALRLADNFAEYGGGLTESVVIASGESLVDAVTASALAGSLDAPVLLTRSNVLLRGVANYIEERDVTSVYVVGGRAAISQSVVRALEALDSSPDVMRLHGATRYETAVDIAEAVYENAEPYWCDGDSPAAILVNGGQADGSLAGAVAVGPAANRLGVPVLLTAARSLPESVSDFIAANGIEHIMIVGSDMDVSAGVESDLKAAGVRIIERVKGDTPGELSVAVIKDILSDPVCETYLAPVSIDTVAIVHEDALPDGISSAPVLATSLAEGALVPMLLVSDNISGPVETWLNSTPDTDSGVKVHLGAVAIGGTAAVPPGTMKQVLAAAASTGALVAQIGATTDTNEDGTIDENDAVQEGATMFRLYFNDSVDATKAVNAVRDGLEVNGVPAWFAATNGVVHGQGAGGTCDADVVTVTLNRKLAADSVLTMTDGAEVGARGDKRALAGDSVTVASIRPDRTRPIVNMIIIAGQTTADITVTDNKDETIALSGTLELTINDAAKTLTVSGNTVTSSAAFEVGDRVTVSAGAAVDAAGNESIQRTFTAAAAAKSPKINTVLLSGLGQTMSAKVALPTALTGGAGTADDSSDAPDIWIKAKEDGAAQGAAGNEWTVSLHRRSDYDATMQTRISTVVDSRGKRIAITFHDGPATFGDLADKLNDNADFARLFEAVVDPDPSTVTTGSCGVPARDKVLSVGTFDPTAATSTVSLTGGQSSFAIEVTFSGYISAVDDAQLLADVLDGTLKRLQVDTPAKDLAALRTDLEGTRTADDYKDFTAPSKTVRYTYFVSDLDVVPLARDTVVTTAVATTNLADTAYDDTEAVATGYAADDSTTTRVDESKNAGSRVRIQVSSRVEIPEPEGS